MKKLVSIVLLCAMLVSCFAGCGMQKGQIVGNGANYENLAFDGDLLTVPTTVPTSGASKWTGTSQIKSDRTVTLDPNGDGDYSDSTTNHSGADITWFDPNKEGKSYDLTEAADLVGFLILRLWGSRDLTTGKDTETPGTFTPNGFEGYTFNLKVDVDLNGVDIQVYNSAYIFSGTFDGNEHVIFNYNQGGVNSGSKGFFSKVTGNGCLKNFSLLEGTITVFGAKDTSSKNESTGNYSVSNGSKEGFGVAVGELGTETGKTVTISNVYTNCVVQNKNDTTVDVFNKVGGVVGLISGSGTAVIQNCECAGTFNLTGTGTNLSLSTDKKSVNTGTSKYGQYTGGIVAAIKKDQTPTVNITNCTFSGTINSNGNYAGGILAYNEGPSSNATGKVVITNCSNTGTVTTNGGYAAGIVAGVKSANELYVSGCVNDGDVTGGANYGGGIAGDVNGVATVTFLNCSSTTNATINGGSNDSFAGIVGRIYQATTVKIDTCTVASTITARNLSGGIVGYIVDSNDVDVLNCDFSGSITAQRASGGVVGFFDINTGNLASDTEPQSITVTDCDVLEGATLNLTVSSGNPSVGGIVGRVRGNNFTMSDCDFAGNMVVTFNTENDVPMSAAVLVGHLFDNNAEQVANPTASISDCTVGGTLRFVKTIDDVCVAAIYVGGTSCKTKPSVTYSNLSHTCSVDKSAGNEGETVMEPIQYGDNPAVVGYQVGTAYAPEGSEEGAEATLYALRYIATLNIGSNEDINGVGFKVTLKYVDATTNTIVTKDEQTVYAATVYKSLKGGENNLEYTAESFYAEYLYTLVIKDIPVGYTIADNTLQVEITPFTAKDADTLTESYTTVHGLAKVAQAN